MSTSNIVPKSVVHGVSMARLPSHCGAWGVASHQNDIVNPIMTVELTPTYHVRISLSALPIRHLWRLRIRRKRLFYFERLPEGDYKITHMWGGGRWRKVR